MPEPRLKEHLRILRYLVVGLVNTGFGYASFATFVLAGAPLWLSVTGSTILAFLFNFMSYGQVVFGSTSARQLPRFLAMYTLLGASNFVLLRLLVWIGLDTLLAQALLVPALAVTGYIGFNRFVFNQSAVPARPLEPNDHD